MIDWIPITDRLPNDGQRVLTWCNIYENYSPMYKSLGIGVHKYFSEYAGDPEAWWIGKTNHLVTKGEITHWAEWNSPHDQK